MFAGFPSENFLFFNVGLPPDPFLVIFQVGEVLLAPSLFLSLRLPEYILYVFQISSIENVFFSDYFPVEFLKIAEQ